MTTVAKEDLLKQAVLTAPMYFGKQAKDHDHDFVFVIQPYKVGQKVRTSLGLDVKNNHTLNVHFDGMKLSIADSKDSHVPIASHVEIPYTVFYPIARAVYEYLQTANVNGDDIRTDFHDGRAVDLSKVDKMLVFRNAMKCLAKLLSYRYDMKTLQGGQTHRRVLYKSKTYVVKKEGRTRYITTNKVKLYLKDITGEYKYVD